MASTFNKTLLSDDLSYSLKVLLEKKTVLYDNHIVSLDTDITHVLFSRDLESPPLGFTNFTKFQETLCFSDKYLGALVFESENGKPELYANVGGILYAVWK